MHHIQNFYPNSCSSLDYSWHSWRHQNGVCLLGLQLESNVQSQRPAWLPTNIFLSEVTHAADPKYNGNVRFNYMYSRQTRSGKTLLESKNLMILYSNSFFHTFICSEDISGLLFKVAMACRLAGRRIPTSKSHTSSTKRMAYSAWFSSFPTPDGSNNMTERPFLIDCIEK